MIKDYLRHAFISPNTQRLGAQRSLDAEHGPEIEQVNEVPQLVGGGWDDGSDRAVRAKLVMTMNWVIAFILVAGFLFILAEAIWQPEHKIPTIVENIVFTTLGYFGGSLTSFMGFKSPSVGQTRDRGRKGKPILNSRR